MSNLKYWYIDDEEGKPEETTIRMLVSYGIKAEQFSLRDYQDFGSLKKAIIKLIDDNFGGLILDLRLDGQGNYPTAFNATALAQELRSVASMGETCIYPIVLTSTDEKIKETYNNDKSSHDLFDYKIHKSSENWEKRSKKLISLAHDYKKIDNTMFDSRSAESILYDLLGKETTNIKDVRIIEKLVGLIDQGDKHYFVNFIIKQFFHFTNPLVNRRVLFAKLGLFIDNLANDEINGILELFEVAKYTGIFSKGWDRWWQVDIDAVIKEKFQTNFSFIPAEDRVNIINDKLNLNLKPFEGLEYNFSTEYSTICEATKKPIDHLEGFRISTSHDFLPWQMHKYLSLYAYLERIRISEIKPHPLELENIKNARNELGI
ncbi:hypothetical protein [Psychrobacter sp. I-STPA6b]|uniref:hypothetical protein n=1 Tax=Psychrobacter sp. I-STPA6b TaxID=2585718 RepID=UPI001D0C6126|nr:hypothetical protein [Psychrobacter sp. I-STPA6b]